MWRRIGGDRIGGGGGWKPDGCSALAQNRQFHLRNGREPRVKTPWTAFSGVSGKDAAGLRPVQFSIIFPIPLVKSDFKIGTEPIQAIHDRIDCAPLCPPYESFLYGIVSCLVAWVQNELLI